MKNVLKKLNIYNDSSPIDEQIRKLLININNSPNTVTKKCPMELLFSYKPKTLLDILNPKQKKLFDESNNQTKSKSENQIKRSESNKKSKVIIKSKYKVNENVLYRNHFKEYVKWIPAKVAEIVSPVTYLIRIRDHIRYVQENQLRKSALDNSYHPTTIFVSKDVISRPIKPIQNKVDINDVDDKPINEPSSTIPCTCVPKTNLKKKKTISKAANSPSTIIRPRRIIRKPDRFGY